MATTTKQTQNPASSRRDILAFFKTISEENGGDGQVWVKSSAKNGSQVILQGRTPYGETVKFPPIRSGDPICLSEWEPDFNVLKNCKDLVTAANKGLIKLMTSDEADAHFKRKGGLLKQAPSALKEKAQAQADSRLSFNGLSEGEVDNTQRMAGFEGDDSRVIQNEEDVVHPRLLDIVARIGDFQTPDEDRAPASEVLAELIDIEDALDYQSYEYLKVRGYWPSVKNWAKAKMAQIEEDSEFAPKTDDIMQANDLQKANEDPA